MLDSRPVSQKQTYAWAGSLALDIRNAVSVIVDLNVIINSYDVFPVV